MNTKRKAPAPIIDNLDYLNNPFKQTQFNASEYLDVDIRGTDLDLEYALKFLYSYNGSTATFNSYRREIERLLQWAWRIENISVLMLKREHIEDYIQFCLNPPTAWIGTKNVVRFKSKNGRRIVNSDWRPFVVSLSKTEHKQGIEADPNRYLPSQSAIKATFTALSSFYDYLLQETLVDANPVLLIRQKSKYVRKEQIKPVVRRISNLQWDYVLETAELMAQDHPEEHERTLFIMSCLFSMYLRISELVADERSVPTMGHFRKDLDGNWWFHVTGKGNKTRTITVSNEMLQALRRYRQSLSLSPLPTPDDRGPLIAKVKGTGPVTSTRHIRTIVQDCFDKAYERMKNDGLEDDALDLKAATVHWLRHTGISEDVKFRPREHVRDDAGHASMATTDRYIESDLRERHASGKKKRLSDF
ncbi:MAG: site-specific integrase [Cellvibrionaceae bacterium]|nr:site-specific integrase [Cellvibrionaceae bacterium]